MHTAFEPYRRALKEIGPLLGQHVFILVNGIIGAVIVLLILFGQDTAGIFLGAILALNILMGFTQDFRARVALETLQLLTALRVTRVNIDNSETTIFVEEVIAGDRVRLKLGDQIPCDGKLLSATGLEISQALTTGESDSFSKSTGDSVMAGDIITAGTGVVVAATSFKESRIARMTADAKKYTSNPSEIQRSVTTIIKYAGYVLIAILLFVIVRGVIVDAPILEMVNNAGALASSIVPQGLVAITTLLFAFGAASYSKRHVLFQEINATEKLGRIKNLCMDKTGTLTENILTVADFEAAPGSTAQQGQALAASYIHGSGDTSQVMDAIARFIGDMPLKEPAVSALPFSSWRQYGAVQTQEDGGLIILVGAPDKFLPHLSSKDQRDWLSKKIELHAAEGKRILCVARYESSELPHSLTGVELSAVAIITFESKLREGIKDAISFFQNRGVRIRIITGDHPETARVVASRAGIANTENIITGKELAHWSEEDLFASVKNYTIFARIEPEQKVLIIKALKKHGFTAMVGDGANDALAIKKADLGIAMFDGVQATRRLAGVILTNNSFTALPGGVQLADNFIVNIEIFASVFLNQSFLALFLFILLAVGGTVFPLTPLNITLINYFAVGLPGILISYWALCPPEQTQPASTRNFLRRVLPLPALLASIQAIAIAWIHWLSPSYLQHSGSNTLVLISVVTLGFVFLALTPKVFYGKLSGRQRTHLLIFGAAELILLLIVLSLPAALRFFTATPLLPDTMSLPGIALVGTLCVLLLYFARNAFILKK